MTDRSTVFLSPAITSLVRMTMRCSPTHRFDAGLPDRIAGLLAEVDRSEERKRDELGDVRARM